MLVAFSVAPSGGGTDSVGDVVAEAVRVVRESGLPNETTSMFTTIEAPTWDEAMEVVKRAVEAVAARAPRVSLVLKADIRPGWTGQLQAKVERVERALAARSPTRADRPRRRRVGGRRGRDAGPRLRIGHCSGVGRPPRTECGVDASWPDRSLFRRGAASHGVRGGRVVAGSVTAWRCSG